MAFQIKDFRSVSASLVNLMKSTQQKLTDFNVGSIVRSMLDAVAAEIDELYQQMFIGLKEAIPVATYNSFDFSALPAVAASGMVRVNITAAASNVVIPANTVFSAAGQSVNYTSQADAVITPGNTYADIMVVASQAGSAGNLTAGATFTLAPVPTGFVSASNLAAFLNGSDAETDDERKLRFNAFIQSLARGTVAALEYGLKTTALTDSQGNITERVVNAKVVEPYLTDPGQPISLVNCYIHNGVGGTSSALVTEARKIIYGYYDTSGNAVPGWKAAGVKVEVYASTEQALNITAVLTEMAGYVKADLVTAATAALQAYINELGIGAAAIKSEMIARAMEIDGVYNFSLSAPASDTTPAANVKLMPGTIAIT